ncbi:hypothetical protein IR083_10595 [Dysgonomonas sp. GY75]|uniref:hypothetical protein n=1 Tax=Dysgonomonas sp. GY75 TaxID=2780419 RepID=UPI0018836C5C|nr:hypothetical protein [Dysgonomonas sp. GY75]MBF0649269.1 hypothetical protein [Dysgonomonas sp. GY75]
MQNAQELLYLWFKEVGDVRYERIKQTCDYLNLKLELDLEKPIYNIFYPLLYSGTVEFAGNSRYHMAPECIISKHRDSLVVLNPVLTDGLQQTSYIGIYLHKDIDRFNGPNRFNFNLESILGNMPSIDHCVLSMQEVYDIRRDDFEHYIGVVSRKINDTKKWYFIDCEHNKCYAIPHHSINPDALNIAYSYDRVVKQENNGIYDVKNKELRVPIFHMPIIIYRALMIESLFAESMPYIDNGYYVFKNVNRRAYTELNRIFCESIKTN